VTFLIDHDGKFYETPIRQGIESLIRTQLLPVSVAARETEGGGWGLNNSHTSEATTTGMALRAELTYTKRNHLWQNVVDCRNSMVYGQEWLINHHRINGGWSDLLHHATSATATCWAGLALWECLDIEEREKPAIKTLLGEGLDRVEMAQHQGLWNKTLTRTHLASHVRSTAQCAYLLCKLEERHLAGKAIAWLKEQQNSREGSWNVGHLESPIETAVWAVMALLASGLESSDKMLDQGITYLLKHYLKKQGGWPEKPGGHVDHATSLYACLALEAYHRAIPLAQ
jgi:prenyltransferase beta subunit